MAGAVGDVEGGVDHFASEPPPLADVDREPQGPRPEVAVGLQQAAVEEVVVAGPHLELGVEPAVAQGGVRRDLRPAGEGRPRLELEAEELEAHLVLGRLLTVEGVAVGVAAGGGSVARAGEVPLEGAGLAEEARPDPGALALPERPGEAEREEVG